jgi:hypothetical protein
MNNKYYTYAYLREDRTPYYIGKGKGHRAYVNHHRKKRNCISIPQDKSRIIFLKQNLTEEEAFKHEIYMIAVFGRKDLGTGILRNKTNGGDGSSGAKRSEEFKRKISNANKGKILTQETKDKISKAHKGRQTWLGKKLTEEHKRNCANAKYGNEWNCKRYSITFECGKTIIITGLNKFSRENGYNSSSLSDINNGRKKRHKDIVAVKRLDTTP